MNARDALFLISGISLALLVSLVLVLTRQGALEREMQARIDGLQRTIDDERAKQARERQDEALKRDSELAKARQAEERARSALEAAKRSAAAAMQRAEAAIAAVKAQAEAQRKADQARDARETTARAAPPEPVAVPRPEQPQVVPEALFDQASSLEKNGRSAEAVRVYVRAARSGDGKAANRLGEIYAKGVEGVPSNYAEALKWCNTARALGETPNCAAR